MEKTGIHTLNMFDCTAGITDAGLAYLTRHPHAVHERLHRDH